MNIKVIVLQTKDGLNGKGGKIGILCLIQCNECGIKKWIPGSKIKYGAGKFCSKPCYTKDQAKRRLDKSLKWQGGKVIQLGYYMIKQLNGRYEREHRLIMEKNIGRKLKKGEDVHHVNGNKLDNRIENLQLLLAKDHHKGHYQKMKIDEFTKRFIKIS